MTHTLTKIVNPDAYVRLYNEWIVTNGIGGYASMSLCGTLTRKYHAYLMAALPAPFGRSCLLNYISEVLIFPDNTEVALSHLKQNGNEYPAENYLKEFRLEDGLPIWLYEVRGVQLEKRVFLIHQQNTVHIYYKVLNSAEEFTFKWTPYFHFRTSDQTVNSPNSHDKYQLHINENQYEFSCPPFPILKLTNSQKATFKLNTENIERVFFEIEAKRGYESEGNVVSLGYFKHKMQAEQEITFIASTESWQNINILRSQEALILEKFRRKGILKTAPHLKNTPSLSKLSLASDQFIIAPVSRYEDMIWLKAAGEEMRSVIAGYPWFTDWGRDTMIGLEGLTMTTGRLQEAHAILRTFAYYIKDGLIPNLFPDGERVAIYNTADASLWFFHALDRYIEIAHDRDILEFLYPKLLEIIEFHIKGTKFGIKMDSDALISQGQEGYALTWMDAKVGDWVVTPRRGKAVEINALWYNALKLMSVWFGKYQDLAERCYESFNQRFWNETDHYLYDVIDGSESIDHSFRPNQLLAISLRFPVLDSHCWKDVLEKVKQELLTPYGLRTLSPSDQRFKRYYDGDLKARDAAYHQGTVWPWLMGPFIDVFLKVHPDAYNEAYEFLKQLENYLDNCTTGSLPEIFDAQDPYHRRGCISQAWSVGEILRSLVKVYQGMKH